MTVWAARINGLRYEFEVSPPTFDVDWDRQSKVLAFFSIRHTQFRNIMWVRIISFRWGWPFVSCVGAFTDADEPIEGDEDGKQV